MKKVFFLLLLVLVGVAVFVNYTISRVFDHGHHLSINISENAEVYKLKASYNRYKTRRLQRYMDAQLHQKHVFENARIDGDITLDDIDRTHFYIKANPGNLYIKLDKHQNDSASYKKMKELAEGIKVELARD